MQDKVVWGIFWYFGQLERPVRGQILKFMQNRYEIRIQHAKNVGSSHLWVFLYLLNMPRRLIYDNVDFGTFLVFWPTWRELGGPNIGIHSKWLENLDLAC